MKNLATYFKKQADGETEHYQKFRQYLRDSHSPIIAVEAESAPVQFADCKTLGDLYIVTETQTTLSISGIMAEARMQNDEKTQAWLQWALEEQIEEEDEALKFRNLCATCDWPMLELIYKE
jgi:ferritin